MLEKQRVATVSDWEMPWEVVMWAHTFLSAQVSLKMIIIFIKLVGGASNNKGAGAHSAYKKGKISSKLQMCLGPCARNSWRSGHIYNSGNFLLLEMLRSPVVLHDLLLLLHPLLAVSRQGHGPVLPV